ncbi:hypothetical protein ACPPVS_06445 [Cellulomonas sp. McL0617]|uniref:hypothetical protein n=1 Tax=Cellulomonas sp. McL0617 TaxID=3415675 RepID=UPI003CF4F74F
MRSAVGLALVALVTGCGQRAAPETSGGGWQTVTNSPLSARQYPSVTWVVDRFIVVGGDDGPPCPRNASCVLPLGSALRDGAAFDPATGLWQRIADAPTPILTEDDAVLGSTLYVLMGAPQPQVPPAFLAFNALEDTWTSLPMPPSGAGELVAYGDVLLTVPGTDENARSIDSWFDPTTNTWHEIPDDPLGPSYDRSMTVVDGRAILTAKDLVPDPGAEKPSIVRLAQLDRTLSRWTVLPDSEVIGSGPVAVAGRLVFPDVGGADGGAVGNWGREYPDGGIFDPATGMWTNLPSAPGTSSWPRVVVSDRVVVGDVLLDPVDGTTSTRPADPWSNEDFPTIATSPTEIFAWGGAHDRSTTGYLLPS